MAFKVSFSDENAFSARLTGAEQFDANLTETVTKMVAEYYEGPYEFTPGEEEQTIPVEDLVSTQNIKINPIPLNYGRLTYSGGILKVW